MIVLLKPSGKVGAAAEDRLVDSNEDLNSCRLFCAKKEEADPRERNQMKLVAMNASMLSIVSRGLCSRRSQNSPNIFVLAGGMELLKRQSSSDSSRERAQTVQVPGDEEPLLCSMWRAFVGCRKARYVTSLYSTIDGQHSRDKN